MTRAAHRTTRNRRRSRVARAAWVAVVLVAFPGRAPASADDFSRRAAPLFQRFCVECHSGARPKGRIHLARLMSTSSFADDFKAWQKVIGVLETRKMPPAEKAPPDDSARRAMIAGVRRALADAGRRRQGDPGRVVMRRLTSAEYGYTIRDLTGLDLEFDDALAGDAAGGEGFTNVGAVQFMEDSTLERYLEAARRVAAHAVIGAGPLAFYDHAGKSGLELSAIERIQRLYRAHGFRTGAGEGARPFGLDRYPRAFHVAWRFRHRARLGLEPVTLRDLAAREGIAERFAEHIWSVLDGASPSFPASEIVDRWNGLPVPDDSARADVDARARRECEEIYRRLRELQSELARSSGHAEEVAVLTADALEAVVTRPLDTKLTWPEGARAAELRFSVGAVDPRLTPKPVIIWRRPRLRFQGDDGAWLEYRPLSTAVPAATFEAIGFGSPPGGDGTAGIAPHDFVTVGLVSLSIEVEVPAGMRQAAFSVDAVLDVERGEDCVVHCDVFTGDRPERRRPLATFLASPGGAAFRSFSEGTASFARDLPQVSHREPAPSDRDPIPPPFDNTYNSEERNWFHTKVKYHRDDRFLVERLLDDESRRRLDAAWTDLLASFDYHDVFLRFVAEKYGLDTGGSGVAGLQPEWIDELPPAPRAFVRHLHDDRRSGQEALARARPGHVDDVVRFATRAWRRPLAAAEERRLRQYYDELRDGRGIDHAGAIRTLLARVLVAPPFIYRIERGAPSPDSAPLSAWELATRLSYFLWSSAPDEKLRRAARSGALAEPDELARQTRRMLQDPKARRLATEFFGQWFGFYRFDNRHGVDAKRFPEFSERIRSSMYEAAIRFFDHIVRNDRPTSEILFADYAFLNRDLIDHYGLRDGFPATEEIERLDGAGRAHRGGLLGLGAVLTVTSAPLRTSPVKRGDWILRRVIGTPVPTPPADAGSIPADDVLADGKTVRERLEAHRRDPSCIPCHSRIDALGFALENFDPVGRWRETYRDGRAIESSGTLEDGTEIAGLEGLRGYLAGRMAQFRRTLCSRLLGYALGRSELPSDGAWIDETLAALGEDDRFSTIVVRLVKSRQFRFRRGVEHEGETAR